MSAINLSNRYGSINYFASVRGIYTYLTSHSRSYLKAVPIYLVIFAGLLLSYFGTATASTSDEMKKFVISISATAGQTIAESQLQASDGNAKEFPEGLYGVSLLEEFRAPSIWFQAFQVESRQTLDEYLAALGVKPDSVKESLFINSPELGGGPKAGQSLRDGHSVYMIQRTIPDVGLSPPETMLKISKGSQSVIEKIGDSLEWDHSYLTSEGTFCVYRATDTAKILEHAEIAGVPADPITKVEHIIRNFDFAKTNL